MPTVINERGGQCRGAGQPDRRREHRHQRQQTAAAGASSTSERFVSRAVGPGQISEGEGGTRIFVCGPLDDLAQARVEALRTAGNTVAHAADLPAGEELCASYDAIVVESGFAVHELPCAVSAIAAHACAPVLAVFAATRRPVREQRRLLIARGATDATPTTTSTADFLFRLNALMWRARAPAILVATEDREAARRARDTLCGQGWHVGLAHTLVAAKAAYTEGSVDALLLDPEISNGHGLVMVEALRSAGAATPVIVESRRGGRTARLAALALGVDDFAEGPMDDEELVVRIRRLLRGRCEGRRLVFATLEFKLDDQVVRHGGHRLDLRQREYDMLVYLAQLAQVTVPRHILLEDVWNAAASAEAFNLVSVTKSRLVAKLRAAGVPDIVFAENGGYRFDPSPLRRTVFEEGLETGALPEAARPAIPRRCENWISGSDSVEGFPDPSTT